jgi:radical SAM superfamily enzyme YgiQ (UPF0313 family)
MSDVVLIVPKAKTEISPLVYPPLGLLYIAAALEMDGHDVSIYDMREEHNMIENVPEAEYYGFTAVTPQINDVVSSAEHLRDNTKAFLFIGGPHASCFPHELEDLFDAVIVGEGEAASRSVVMDKFVQMDFIPIPARHLLDDNKIVNSELWEGYGYGSGPKATTLITSRGCPWQCAFCANMPQKVRFRSISDIVNEIEIIIDTYGCKNFRFIDDNFIMRKDLLMLARNLESLNIEFRCAGRSDLITDETCEHLKRAGCKELGLGIESADNNVLKLLNKRETVEQHRKAIETAKFHGLKVKGFFMAGLPGESWETIEKNKRFVEETGLDKVIVTLFTPYPGCAIWQSPERFGIRIIENDWDRYFQTYPSESAIESELASKEELTAHFKEFVKYIRSVQK